MTSDDADAFAILGILGAGLSVALVALLGFTIGGSAFAPVALALLLPGLAAVIANAVARRRRRLSERRTVAGRATAGRPSEAPGQPRRIEEREDGLGARRSAMGESPRPAEKSPGPDQATADVASETAAGQPGEREGSRARLSQMTHVL